MTDQNPCEIAHGDRSFPTRRVHSFSGRVEDIRITLLDPEEKERRRIVSERFLKQPDVVFDGEEEDEPHLDHYSEEELFELAGLGEELLAEFPELPSDYVPKELDGR